MCGRGRETEDLLCMALFACHNVNQSSIAACECSFIIIKQVTRHSVLGIILHFFVVRKIIGDMKDRLNFHHKLKFSAVFP